MGRTVVSGAGGGGSVLAAGGNWATGTFGSGLIRVYGSSAADYSFVVPSGVTSIRVRCFGAGGGGGSSSNYAGGGGGGFSIGEFSVSSGESYAVTVGAGGDQNAAGGTSSFGTLISATGGAGAADTSTHAGGIGVGGYINHEGGYAATAYCGGGGVASVFGHGSNGIASSSNGNTTGNTKRSGGAGGGLGYSGSNLVNALQGPWKGLTARMDSFSGSTSTAVRDQARVFAVVSSIDELGTGPGGIAYGVDDGINGGGGASGASGGWPGGGGGPGGNFRIGADGCVIVEY